MSYGWGVSSDYYGLGWSGNSFYIHYVDHIQVDLSSPGSVTRRYPGYEYSDISIIPLGVRFYIFGLTTSVSMDADGVPEITISWGSFNSSPTTFYIVSTRMDFRSGHVSKIGGVYGIDVRDKSGNGAAWVPDAEPFYFLERYEGGDTWYKPQGHNDIAGWCEVETWSDKPPLCLWKSKRHYNDLGQNGDITWAPPSLNALPSRNPPTKRNYRWVIGCEQGEGFSGASGSSWNSPTKGRDYMVYVYDAYKPPRVVNYGIELIGDFNSLVLGDGAPMEVRELMDPLSWPVSADQGTVTAPEFHRPTSTQHARAFSHLPWLIDGQLHNGSRHVTVPGLRSYELIVRHTRDIPKTGPDPTKSIQWWRDYIAQSNYIMLQANTYYLDQIIAVD